MKKQVIFTNPMLSVFMLKNQKTILWGYCLDEGCLIIVRGDYKNGTKGKFSEYCLPAETHWWLVSSSHLLSPQLYLPKTPYFLLVNSFFYIYFASFLIKFDHCSHANLIYLKNKVNLLLSFLSRVRYCQSVRGFVSCQ